MAGFGGQKFYSDAQHIAIASILKADILVSWNFRHNGKFLSHQTIQRNKS